MTAKDGSKQYTDVRVNIAEGSNTPSETDAPTPSGKEAKNAEISLENPFSADYKDTVLVGTNAQLKVRLTDEEASRLQTQRFGIVTFNVKPTQGETITVDGKSATTIAANAGDAATLRVEAADIAEVFSYNLKWITADNSDDGKFKIAGQTGDVGYTAFNPTDKTIKLTFTNYVYAPSVIKEQFTVTYDGVKQTVTDVEVANNTITLKIPDLAYFNDDKDFVVDIASGAVDKTVKDGVQYRIVSADGQFINSTDLSVTFSAKGKRK